MELDSRIKEGKRPLTCFDVKEAIQFIGKECYLSNSIADYADLNNVTAKRILDDVSNTSIPYSSNPAGIYCYCLPCEWVKPEEPEKKYRPFSLDEFLKIFDIGDQIDFKGKGYCDDVKVAMFTGYVTDVDRSNDEEPGAVELMLGCFHYSLSDLFKDYELFLEDKWQPFGVIDE